MQRDALEIQKSWSAGWSELKSLVLNGLTSEHSKRAYSKALDDFQKWCCENQSSGFNKATVQKYKAGLEARGLAPSSINVQLSAIRRLAIESGDNGLIDLQTSGAISRIKGAKSHGARTGNWLTQAQAEEMLQFQDTETLAGKRNRAILATLIGCGLRREELASLRVDHIQQRDARWVIVDLIGKGQRVRTVPMPAWTKAAIDDWTRSAAIVEGPVFRAVTRSNRISEKGLTTQGIFDVVKRYGRILKIDIAPHDLRRSFAKLAHKGHAAIEQIQMSLGHSSIQTTERYLGVDQDLSDAPCDRLGIRV